MEWMEEAEAAVRNLIDQRNRLREKYGNQLSLEPFQANQRHLFYGKAMLIVRTRPDEAGSIRITAASDGYEPATATLRSK